MWARFTGVFRWPARGPWHRRYEPGMRASVTRECLAAAVAAGAAERIAAPSRAAAAALRRDPYGEPPA
jgi:hypothetical protein